MRFEDIANMNSPQTLITTDFKIPVLTETCLGCSKTDYYLAELRHWKKGTFFLICEKCHFEQLDAYCSSCDDHFLVAGKKHPSTVDCPQCQTAQSIPESAYDQAKPLVSTESLPISAYLKLAHYGFETELLEAKLHQPIYDQNDCSGCSQDRLYLADFDKTEGNVFLICKVCQTTNNELRCAVCKSYGSLDEDQIQRRVTQWFCKECKNTFTLPKDFYENLQLLLTKEEIPKELWPENVYEEPSHWQCQNCYKTHPIPKTYYQHQKEHTLSNDFFAKAFLSKITGWNAHGWQCRDCQETDGGQKTSRGGKKNKGVSFKSDKIKFYSPEAGLIFFCPLIIWIYAYQKRAGIRAWALAFFAILCWSILLVLFPIPH